ncbi:MAG: amidohydrolase [Spirochaetales bacterium]|nr:amidohydrolase [Spirochaetales bacterium]
MLNSEINAFIDELYPELLQFRRETHRHPELGLAEVETTARAKALLSRHGIESQYIFDNIGLHFLIEGEGEGNTILLRGDMDCLPLKEPEGLPFRSEYDGRMHACGHDLNTTYALGSAICLNRFRHLLKGRVKFVLQPGEEGYAGARIAIEHGVLEGVSPKYGFCLHTHPEHLVGHVGIRNGNATAANDNLRIVVKGKGGHAAYPHKTIDPVVISAHVILALQTFAARYHHPCDPFVISICRLSSGTATNVTPYSVELQGTVRSFNSELRASLPEQLERLCRSTAQAFGGDCDVTYEFSYPAIVVTPECYRDGYTALCENLGEEHVDSTKQPTMGAEDFGYFAQLFPCAQIRIGTQNEEPRSALPLHNPNILFSEESIYWGVRAGVSLALGLA